jgi:hypothetical protein
MGNEGLHAYAQKHWHILGYLWYKHDGIVPHKNKPESTSSFTRPWSNQMQYFYLLP